MPAPQFVLIPEPNQESWGFKFDHPEPITFNAKKVEIPSNFGCNKTVSPANQFHIFVFSFWYDGQYQNFNCHYSSGLLAESSLDMVAFVLTEFFYEKAMRHIDGLEGYPALVFRERLREFFHSYVHHVSDLPATPAYAPTQAAYDPTQAVETASKHLPGVDATVEYPCDCGKKADGKPYTSELWLAIQHLNDLHEEWTREKIADWIDELHDNGVINAEFSPWGEGLDNDPPVGDTESEIEFKGAEWKDIGWVDESAFVAKFEPENFEVEDFTESVKKLTQGHHLPPEETKKIIGDVI